MLSAVLRTSIRMIILLAGLEAPAAFSDHAHFDEGFQRGIQSATSLQGRAFNALSQYKPQNVIRDYSDHPKEMAYQNNADVIKQDAVLARNNDPTAKMMVDGIDGREQKYHYSKDPNSTVIQNIKKNADSIYDVITGQFGDCTKQSRCTTTYQQQDCEESPASTNRYCKKLLNVEMVPHKEETHYTLTAHLSVKDHKYAGVNMNAVTGQIHFLGPKDASFRLDGRLPNNIDCHSLQGKILSQQGDAKLDNITLPSCSNGLSLDFHISDGHQKHLRIDIASTKISYEQKDHWDNQCIGFENVSHCTFKEERCVASQSTHVIQGIPVMRDCWEKEAIYQCGRTSTEASCQLYRDQGCEQIDSSCKEQDGGGCILYRQTFRCPIKQCTDVGMICNGETYCLDGNCVKQQKQADPDFQRAVSALSATNEAAKDFTQFNSIFAGKKRTCDKLAIGVLDCCADKGWGKDHILSCSQEEKDLKVDKENLLTVYVGEYCKNDPAGICIEHRKAYCVFPSRLARIVQQQGRAEQLHILFGNPEQANCRGITREEFAQLDLGKMDFSDFYSDISQKARIEDKSKLDQRIKDKTTTWEQEKKANG